ncbi:exosome complex component Rrp45p [Trichomonascus vanleenenianus]|uniref:exosome non-catalytic core subunit RRP45 n=1 Tax=Trichomonascus vanleenenianus TaxID=2268995 RepID=UPI003EC9FFA6
MPKAKDISTNEQNFLLSLLDEGLRIDERNFEDFRDADIQFGDSLGHVEVKLGNTRLVVRVSAEVAKPYEDRPYEGLFLITTDISAMASPLFENGRQSEDEMLVTRLIEKAIRRSNALDLESLVIVAGKSCWMIRADVHYLGYDGGFVDATCIGVIAALMHFKVPDISIDGDKTIIHSVEERAPVPLSILHVPICVTFSFFKLDKKNEDGEVTTKEIVLVDSTAREEALRHSEMTITINKNRDICQIAKPGGQQIEAITIMRCANVAYNIAVNLTALIHKRLKEDDAIRNKGNLAIELSAENER